MSSDMLKPSVEHLTLVILGSLQIPSRVKLHGAEAGGPGPKVLQPGAGQRASRPAEDRLTCRLGGLAKPANYRGLWCVATKWSC